MLQEFKWTLNALSLGLILVGSIIQLYDAVRANKEHGERDWRRRYVENLDQKLIEIQGVPSAHGLKLPGGQDIGSIYDMLEGGLRMANKSNKEKLNEIADRLEAADDKRHVRSIVTWSMITIAATLQGVLALVG